MNLMTCNLWLERADYRCVPTSGSVRGDGTAVMDYGIAQEAARRFVDLEADLGRLLASRGNHVHLLRPGLLSFPIKQYAWSGPDLRIIQRSAQELCSMVGNARTLLPKPTLGETGGASWAQVAETLAFLPENIMIVDHQ
jgi:hypothetical protein